MLCSHCLYKQQLHALLSFTAFQWCARDKKEPKARKWLAVWLKMVVTHQQGHWVITMESTMKLQVMISTVSSMLLKGSHGATSRASCRQRDTGAESVSVSRSQSKLLLNSQIRGVIISCNKQKVRSSTNSSNNQRKEPHQSSNPQSHTGHHRCEIWINLLKLGCLEVQNSSRCFTNVVWTDAGAVADVGREQHLHSLCVFVLDNRSLCWFLNVASSSCWSWRWLSVMSTPDMHKLCTVGRSVLPLCVRSPNWMLKRRENNRHSQLFWATPHTAGSSQRWSPRTFESPAAGKRKVRRRVIIARISKPNYVPVGILHLYLLIPIFPSTDSVAHSATFCFPSSQYDCDIHWIQIE